MKESYRGGSAWAGEMMICFLFMPWQECQRQRSALISTQGFQYERRCLNEPCRAN